MSTVPSIDAMLYGYQWATGKDKMVSKDARIPDVHTETLIQTFFKKENFSQSHFELFQPLIFIYIFLQF